MAETPEVRRQDVAQETTDDEALLRLMRARFLEAQSAESQSRTQELEDLRFSNGEQWPADIEQRRTLQRRPCLTINQMPQFLRQVTNEQRQNRPAIRILPADDVADPDTAKVLQGLVRHIEIDSTADIAYDTAFEQAVRSGKGYFCIAIEFAGDRSFDKVIKIKRIRNRFSVYMDPAAQMPDGSDAEWGMIISEVNRDVFAVTYPNADPAKLADYTSIGDGWIDSDMVRIAQYYFIHRRAQTLVLLSDGTVHDKQRVDLRGRDVIAERQAVTNEVWWVVSNGHDVLERGRFPGAYIPIIPVIGDEVDLEGRVEYSGIVRHSRDPQRMYNYWASAETETIALAPRTPWVGTEGQFEGHEQEWASANEMNYSYLSYKLLQDGTGRPLPPPQRNNFEPQVQAITQARLLSRDDIKSTTGLHNASLGIQGNESSGRAIVARQREGDVATFHFPDNLSRALRHAGRVIVGIIPEIYSTRRVVRILGEDNTPKSVTVNAPFEDEDGIERIYRMGVGRYDVIVDTGPSFASKRQETVATQLELTKAFPPLFQVAGDLLVRNMDWPGAQEIAERLVSLLPPEIRPTPNQNDPKEMLRQLQAAVPQLQQQLQALNEFAKQCEAQNAELAQENERLKTTAQSKVAELTVKQEETEMKAALEQRKLALEAQKIELEEQRLALEVAKSGVEIREVTGRAEINEEQVALARSERVSSDGIVALMQTMQAQVSALVETFGGLQETMEQDREARLAPKNVVISRRGDGTLVGAIEPQNGSVT